MSEMCQGTWEQCRNLDEITRLRDQVASLTAAAQFVKSHLDADTFRGDAPDEAHAMIAAAIREGG